MSMTARISGRLRGLAPGLRGPVLGAACLALGACSPLYRYHGYVPLPQDLAQIAVGVDTRDTVAEAVGPPTTGGVLSDGGYYYVRSRFRHVAFLAPEEVDREVLAITFSDAGVVRNVARYGLEDGRVITLETRITEDNVPDRTFIQQLLRNLGNFDASTIVDADEQ